MHVRAFIQARTSSSRFPGKVLAPFHGVPIIEHVVRAAEAAVGRAATLVLTSDEPSDDALAHAVVAYGASVFRGPLDNVLERFQQASRAYPSDWILRLSADSPLLDTDVLKAVIARAASEDCDLVTTIFPRTFPKGRNAEVIRQNVLLSVPAHDVGPDEREHVTAFFYRRADRYRIANVESGRPELAEHSLAVDYRHDLERLEKLTAEELAALAPRWP
jgi:spore coat polysaccharide biosynthesis protein SpsF